MSRALALLRPEPGWSATAAVARAHGMEVTGHPLFEAVPIGWKAPDMAFDALLVGSATTFRLGGPQLAEFTHLPVHAVGEATAAAARSAGFSVARTGEGRLQQVLDETAGERRRFLRLGGEERVELVSREGQEIVDLAIYRMRPLPVSADFADELQTGHPLVALHSAAAARHFGEEIDRFEIARGGLFLLAFGARVARETGPGWAAVHIVDALSDAALLAKAAALCK